MSDVVIIPFFSQQNKTTGKFLLRSCVSTKMCLFLAKRIMDQLGASARLMVPMPDTCDDPLPSMPDLDLYPMLVPWENPAQRLSWDVIRWPGMLEGAKLVISFHEFLAWPLKGFWPKLRVIQMNCLTDREPWPWMAPLYWEAAKAADLLVCLSTPMAQYLREGLFLRDPQQMHANVKAWPLSIDLEKIPCGFLIEGGRDIDVLFALRASATNYSHHLEFLEAIEDLRRRGWMGSVVMTDYTSYLQASKIPLPVGVQLFTSPGDQAAYVELLKQSRIVVAMNDNYYGGMTPREAVWAGCYPLFLRCPGYEALLGKDWPSYIESPSATNIAAAIELALAEGLWALPEARQATMGVFRRLFDETFQRAWVDTIRDDIQQQLDEAER